MLRYTLKRAFMALAVTLTVSVATFFLLDAAGDPAEAIAGPDAPRETIEQIRAQYGFDRPWPVRYGEWALDIARGELGTSFLRRQPVATLIADQAYWAPVDYYSEEYLISREVEFAAPKDGMQRLFLVRWK